MEKGIKRQKYNRRRRLKDRNIDRGMEKEIKRQ
jgi:hypothetical protein